MSRCDLTVVVATKNRPQALAGLLSSLQCQTLPRFKVLIALNSKRSWHPYLDKVATSLFARGVNVITSECTRMTFAELHQFLLASAETEYVCRVDDDHILEPHYLTELLQVIDSDRMVGATGGIVLHPEDIGHGFSPKVFIKTLRSAKKQRVLNTILQLKQHPTDRTLQVPDLYSSFVVRKSIAKRVGGIATCYTSCSYREETDLTLRITLAGFKLYIIPSAIVWHVRANHGGERKSRSAWEKSRSLNEQIFRERLHSWCGDPVSRFSDIWDAALAASR